MKMIRKADTLWKWSVRYEAHWYEEDLQAHNAERNDKSRVEDVRDSERKAEDDAQHSSPGHKSATCLRYIPPRSLFIDIGRCRAVKTTTTFPRDIAIAS